MVDRISHLTLLSVLVMGTGCNPTPKEIPTAFRGEFTFDKSATVTYWNAQTHWPPEVKERLTVMAVPTRLRIDVDRIMVTDIASGRGVTQQVAGLRVGSDVIRLELHSNFAETNKATTLKFDSRGLWLCEGTLFADYQERFERAEIP